MCPMNRVELLHVLTERDLQLHRALVDRIQELLSQSFTTQACYVVGQPQLIEPHVNVRWDPSSGRPHRQVLLGGLNYTLALPNGRHEICIQHWERNTFWLHASFQPVKTKARFTRFSLTTEVHDLARVFSECLDILVKESKPVRPHADRAKADRPSS
jgi:hypothetical protein